jgi:inorganic pyrophosphatase
MKTDVSFWQAMAELINSSRVIIDRPRGSTHPRYADLTYPLDYGYLENTVSSDGGGIDVWIGSLSKLMDAPQVKTLTGILCTFDTLKRDAEIKLLVGCSKEDIQVIRDFHSDMHTLYIPNPVVENDVSQRFS